MRHLEFLPEVALTAGLTLFLVDETDAATSAFGSTRALVLMGLVGAAWIAGRVVAARVLPWSRARAALFAVAAAAVLAVVVVPAYDDETVVEAFPRTARASDTTLDPGPVATAPVQAPEALRTGALQGIDHRAAGTVVFYRDGTRFVVGLEEIDIQPGPDYDVYVVPGSDRDDLADAVRLDDLRGNKGTQYYDVPAGIDLTDAWTLLVWCETFDVPIANATPQA